MQFVCCVRLNVCGIESRIENRIKGECHMEKYLGLMRYVMENGEEGPDRTGVGTLKVFGYQMRFDLAEGFPAVTTKKLHLRSIIYELLWFLRGETNIGSLNENGVHIWDEWADSDGELGPIYGYQWRSWPKPDGRLGCIDQVKQLVGNLIEKPYSRRHIVSAWNVAEHRRNGLTTLPLFISVLRLNG